MPDKDESTKAKDAVDKLTGQDPDVNADELVGDDQELKDAMEEARRKLKATQN